MQARASVEIVRPPTAADAATGLYKCVADLCNQADAWYFGGEPWTEADDKTRAKLLADRIESRQRFVTATQTIIAAEAAA